MGRELPHPLIFPHFIMGVGCEEEMDALSLIFSHYLMRLEIGNEGGERRNNEENMDSGEKSMISPHFL